jgi:hypothetical protein
MDHRECRPSKLIWWPEGEGEKGDGVLVYFTLLVRYSTDSGAVTSRKADGVGLDTEYIGSEQTLSSWDDKTMTAFNLQIFIKSRKSVPSKKLHAM